MRRTIILALAPIGLLAGCGGDDEPSNKAEPKGQPITELPSEFKHMERLTPYARQGQWKRVVGDDGVQVAAITREGETARLITLSPRAGYSIHRARLRCPEGRLTVLDGVSSPEDRKLPDRSSNAGPNGRLSRAGAVACSNEGESRLARVPDVVAFLRQAGSRRPQAGPPPAGTGAPALRDARPKDEIHRIPDRRP